MALQPYNHIFVPRIEYKSNVRPCDDQILLYMIAALKGSSRSRSSVAPPPKLN